jgi:hypothetical protein
MLGNASGSSLVRRPEWMTVPVAVRVWPLVWAARM